MGAVNIGSENLEVFVIWPDAAGKAKIPGDTHCPAI